MGHKPRNHTSLRLFADYHQLYLQDESAHGDLSEAWTAQASDDRVAVAEGVVGIGTASADIVPVDVWVLDAAPADDQGDWHHVTECSIDVASDRVVVAGCTDYFPDARRIPVPSGSLRVRASHRYSPAERYRVQLWPAPHTPPRVVRRWQPAPPPPPPPAVTKPPRTVKKARQQARLGNTQVALDALRGFSERGDASASASVAELLAFQGDWNELVPFATDLLAHPDAVYAGNVFSDMCFLIRRAAEELGDASLIASAASVIPEARSAPAQACLIDGTPLARQPAAGPAELARYREAVAKAQEGKRFKGKPEALARHVFALAVVFRVHDELIAQWPSKRTLVSFDQSVAAARAHAQRGNADEAWRIIESSASTWWPVDDAQVAPVVLVVDPDLHPLMTPARCEYVLSTARGPEGAG